MTILVLQILVGIAAVALGIYIGLIYFSRRPVEVDDVEFDGEERFPRNASRQDAPFSVVSRVTGIKTRQVRRNAFRFLPEDD